MEYKCEFCDTIYPTSYMIRQHTNTAHDVTINRKLNKFIEKVEQFMKKNKIYYFKGLK
jgi:uncharacterized C2H2 Zn-finger protein